MKIDLRQNCEIAGKHFHVKQSKKPNFFDVDASLAEDPYFKALQADGKLKIVEPSELEAVVAPPELTPEQQAEKEAAAKAKELEEAKAELEVLKAKDKPSNKDKKRIAELEAVVGV